ncbi:MAG: hypothetical protein U0232_08095 [Thermomicrobiales bacterium]
MSPVTPARRLPPIVFVLGGLAAVLIVAVIGVLALQADPATCDDRRRYANHPPSVTAPIAAASSAAARYVGATAAAPTPTPTRQVAVSAPTAAANGTFADATAIFLPARRAVDRPTATSDLTSTGSTTISQLARPRIALLTSSVIAVIEQPTLSWRLTSGSTSSADSVYESYFRIQPRKLTRRHRVGALQLSLQAGKSNASCSMRRPTAQSVPSLQPHRHSRRSSEATKFNHLRITCDGQQITVAINDQIVATYAAPS